MTEVFRPTDAKDRSSPVEPIRPEFPELDNEQWHSDPHMARLQISEYFRLTKTEAHSFSVTMGDNSGDHTLVHISNEEFDIGAIWRKVSIFQRNEDTHRSLSFDVVMAPSDGLNGIVVFTNGYPAHIDDVISGNKALKLAMEYKEDEAN